MIDGPGPIQFAAPAYLWLLLLPGLLLLVWAWRVVRHRRDVGRYLARRLVPTPQPLPVLGDLAFWLALVAALALTLLAIARPRAPVALVHRAGVDLVVLLDGSASMRVRDVAPDRWQRSTAFLRRLAEALQWTDDRIALTVFAHIAAPQVRLTKDPNTLFFFLEHLSRESPFPLQDDTTWDTNVEAGIFWGLRLIDKDEELHGRSPNVKAFVLVSDGQVWSGEVERSLTLARDRDIPVFVVGVGTQAGGYIPEAVDPIDGSQSLSPLLSALDRASLLEIAGGGRGRYFELERDGDRAIASQIVETVRRRAGTRGIEQGFVELHRQCLLAATLVLGLGIPWVRDRRELWLLALGLAAALAAVWLALG